MKSTLLLIKSTIMTKMSRKESFIFSLFGNIIYLVMIYYLWRGIYDGDSMAHNRLPFERTIIILYLSTCLSSMYNTNIEWFISRDILSGNIIINLLWPLGFYSYKLLETLGTVLCNLVTNSIPILIFLFLRFPHIIRFDINFMFFLLSVVLSLLLIFNIDFIVGLSSFYTESIWGISTIKTALIAFLSGAIVPIEFFPNFLQRAIELSPFICIYQTPIRILTSNNYNMPFIIRSIFIQLMWCGIISLLGMIFKKKAFKVLVINGG